MAFTLGGGAWVLEAPLEVSCVVLIICAFCLRTSAGVSMKHDTASAVEEAIALMMGLGREWVNGRRKAVLVRYSDVPVLVLVDDSCKVHFIASYVVKNAPAVYEKQRCRLVSDVKGGGHFSI
jgi:hypothetical protein